MKTPGAQKQEPSSGTPVDFLAGFSEQFRDGIRSRARPLRRLARAIIKDHDIEAVHDLRVASRRLRAALPLVRRAVSGRRVKPVARSLKRLTRTLGAAREIDVHMHILEGLRPTAEAVEVCMATEYLMEQLVTRRARVYRKMARQLKKMRIAKLRQEIDELTRKLPDSGIIDDPRDANETLDPLIESAFASLPALSQSVQPQELHRMRIAIKRLRYALEWLAPAAPGGFTSLIHRLVALQDCLGSHHDHVQLEGLLTEMEQDLALRERHALADGVRRCRDRVASMHQEQLALFLELAARLTASTIHDKARIALGLGAKRPHVAIRLHKIVG